MFGYGDSSDLDKLEASLKAGVETLALFCEFPGNPLLSSPDLLRIRKLSQEYDFVVVCDDTISTVYNLDLLPYVDIVVTSLTKLFSGGCNVMGGSVTVSPFSPRHNLLHQILTTLFVDTYFPLDASHMAINSLNFSLRVQETNYNALHLSLLLSSHPSVSTVYYPFLSPTKSLYDAHLRPSDGYGYLLTIKFHKDTDAIAFFDALEVAKGPSLGTDFTLPCPYTLFAHWKEMEWAEGFGVSRGLVRVSVGREEIRGLTGIFERALGATSFGGEGHGKVGVGSEKGGKVGKRAGELARM